MSADCRHLRSVDRHEESEPSRERGGDRAPQCGALPPSYPRVGRSTPHGLAIDQREANAAGEILKGCRML